MENKKNISRCRALPLAVFLASCILISCESFLEVGMPESQLSGPAVFNDLASADAALADIYARMREEGLASGGSLAATSVLAAYSDDMDYFGSNMELEQFGRHTILPSNSLLSAMWNSTYGQVYALNCVIEGAQASSSLPPAGRDRIVGEALFLRSFLYTDLTSLFGDIPYAVATDYRENSTLPRMPQDQVWQHILADLSLSESLVPESYPGSGRIRANRAAVQALIARASLYSNDPVQAAAYATAVIGNAAYGIPQDLETAFLKDSPSIIWSFHPGLAGLNTLDARSFIFTEGPPVKPVLSQVLYDAFEENDLRRLHWIRTVGSGTESWHYPYKYRQAGTTEPSQEYTIVLRIEEQYLIRAEARALTGDTAGAKEDLNAIRSRAGLPDTAASTQQELLQAILRERRFEFFTEQGHRWLDLKRTGNASTVLSPLKPEWQERNILLPIPENELLLNPSLLPQNNGY